MLSENVPAAEEIFREFFYILQQVAVQPDTDLQQRLIKISL
jgi:hypothetical protein